MKIGNLKSGHGTGKTGNLVINFSRHGEHREFKEFTKNTENWDKAGKINNFLGLTYGLTDGYIHFFA